MLQTDRRGLLKLSGCALATIGSFPSVSASSGGWHKPRANPANTATASTGPENGVSSGWSKNVGTVGTPVSADGTVYAATSGGSVLGFDASDGERLWSYDAGDGIDAPVSYADGSVYFTAGAVTYALDASNGEEIWSRRGTGASVSPVNAVDGTVYVGLSSTVYGLGKHTGTVLWKESLSAPLAGSPAVRDGTVYVATRDGNLYGFEADGGLGWTADAGASVAGAPVVTDDGVFVVGGRGGVRSFGTDGDENWSESLTKRVTASPAVDDDHVYVATDEGDVHALRTSSGWEDWVFEGDGSAYAPVVGGGTVYAVLGGTLHAVDASNGNERWSHDGVSGSPAIVGTDLLVGDGRLRRLTGGFRSPDTAVVSASLGSDTVEVGGSVGVDARIRNSGDADGTHQAVVYVDDVSAEFRRVDVPAGETVDVSFSVSFDEPGEHAVRVGGSDAGSVEVTDGSASDRQGDGGDDGTENGTDDGGAGDTDTNTTDGRSADGEPTPGFGLPAVASATLAVLAKRLLASDEDS
ncbi:MAG: outer membrane protein assembly factor BamB [Methanobacteriota archaeon]|jgi:outer membrane protein assembly factor BamB|uniref:PQQ-binding-like beta-propeller repeat protein n=1 Tax=Halorutilus salinus TaxID=2487751 RepID=A0A9Q4GG41_9EURY|nr:PQQ-binding-like beta-propeller repeat protein [Halorutilus salinus]MCX2818287.1 PQQ-binding-like beta-propeller repeat protein [Halorutilus salinus]